MRHVVLRSKIAKIVFIEYFLYFSISMFFLARFDDVQEPKKTANDSCFCGFF